jgi:hypothetical protein
MLGQLKELFKDKTFSVRIPILKWSYDFMEIFTRCSKKASFGMIEIDLPEENNGSQVDVSITVPRIGLALIKDEPSEMISRTTL